MKIYMLFSGYVSCWSQTERRCEQVSLTLQISAAGSSVTISSSTSGGRSVNFTILLVFCFLVSSGYDNIMKCSGSWLYRPVLVCELWADCLYHWALHWLESPRQHIDGGFTFQCPGKSTNPAVSPFECLFLSPYCQQFIVSLCPVYINNYNKKTRPGSGAAVEIVDWLIQECSGVHPIKKGPTACGLTTRLTGWGLSSRDLTPWELASTEVGWPVTDQGTRGCPVLKEAKVRIRNILMN